LAAFARSAVQQLLARPGELERALGEVLTEPKPDVWFPPDASADADADAAAAAGAASGAVVLDPRTRMVYDRQHVYINGESFRAGGRDARLMRTLADQRLLGAAARATLSEQAAALIDEWLAHGWLRSAAE
jgi:50S ribosomal protein L16 3-hydroxylase